MTRLLSNLLKGNFIAFNTQEMRVIDSNPVVEQRLQDLAAAAAESEYEGDDGFHEGLDASEVADLLTMDMDAGGEAPAFEETSGNVIKADAIITEAVQEAEAQAAAIIEQAQNEAAAIKQQAHDEGYQDGMAEARRKEQELIASRNAELDARARDLEEEFETRLNELEPALVDTITDVYSHVFHVDLSSHKDLVTTLVRDTLRGNESSTGFIIHVSADDYNYVSMAKKDFAAVIPGDVPLEVVEDMTLSQGECLIETGNGIFDCGLDTQLQQLRKELMLLSYRKN